LNYKSAGIIASLKGTFHFPNNHGLKDKKVLVTLSKKTILPRPPPRLSVTYYWNGFHAHLYIPKKKHQDIMVFLSNI